MVRGLISYIITAKSFLDLRLLQTLGALEEKKSKCDYKEALFTDVKSKIHRIQIDLFVAKRSLRSLWALSFPPKLAEIPGGKQMEQTISGIPF